MILYTILLSIIISMIHGAPQNYNSPPSSTTSCPQGQLLNHLGGRCVTAGISRNVFVYNPPYMPEEPSYAPEPYIPEPQIEYDLVFVRTPEAGAAASEPIVVPPPQKQTLVYVLTKKEEAAPQKVIQVPSATAKPEVFYVKYNEGENPTLPGGVNLQDALRTGHTGNNLGTGSLASAGLGSFSTGSSGFGSDPTGPSGFGSAPTGSSGFGSAPTGSSGFGSAPTGLSGFSSAPTGSSGFGSDPTGSSGFGSTPSGSSGFSSSFTGPSSTGYSSGFRVQRSSSSKLTTVEPTTVPHSEKIISTSDAHRGAVTVHFA